MFWLFILVFDYLDAYFLGSSSSRVYYKEEIHIDVHIA